MCVSIFMPFYCGGLVHSMNNPQLPIFQLLDPLGRFQFGNIMNKAAKNTFVQVILWLCFSFLLGKDLSMELSRLTNWQTPSQALV